MAPEERRKLRPRLLLIGDDNGAADVLVDAAVRRGLDVVGRANVAAEGVTLARALQPDVIVIVAAMPWMSGRRTIPYLRAVVADALIVMYSRHASDEGVSRAPELGVEAYVVRDEADAHAMLTEVCRRLERR